VYRVPAAVEVLKASTTTLSSVITDNTVQQRQLARHTRLVSCIINNIKNKPTLPPFPSIFHSLYLPLDEYCGNHRASPISDFPQEWIRRFGSDEGFDDYDLNGDGYISYDEWLKGQQDAFRPRCQPSTQKHSTPQQRSATDHQNVFDQGIRPNAYYCCPEGYPAVSSHGQAGTRDHHLFDFQLVASVYTDCLSSNTRLSSSFASVYTDCL